MNLIERTPRWPYTIFLNDLTTLREQEATLVTSYDGSIITILQHGAYRQGLTCYRVTESGLRWVKSLAFAPLPNEHPLDYQLRALDAIPEWLS